MARNILFYFTSTGNTQMIAQRLAAKQKDTLLIPIAKYISYSINEDYDSIGFMYPTFFAGVPDVMANFMKNLKINSKCQYVYIITNAGGFHGNSYQMGTRILNDNGYQVDYANVVKMFSNYIVWYDVPSDSYENEGKYDKEIDFVIDEVICKKKKQIKKENRLFKMWHDMETKKAKSRDKNFKINDNCVKCNLCINICPVNNISSNELGFPEFSNCCEQCLTCIHHCPQQAINYKNRTQKRKRYLNKRIDFIDFNNETTY